MEQLQLLSARATVNAELVLGLTPWTLTAVTAPPTIGYWKTRLVSSPKVGQPQRRWWGGREAGWSLPITPGDDDEDADWATGRPTHRGFYDIEWCGLCQPHPGGYTYRLIKTT